MVLVRWGFGFVGIVISKATLKRKEKKKGFLKVLREKFILVNGDF